MAIKLVTVNPSPEQSAQLVQAVSGLSKDKYDIQLEGNADTAEGAKAVFEQYKPDFVVIASAFTEEESAKITADAQAVNPSVKVMDIPHGLQKEKGPEGVVAFATEQLSKLLG